MDEGLSTISVIFGILALLLLLFKSLVWIIYFATYAFDNKMNDCYAVDGVDQPIALLSISDPAVLDGATGEPVNVKDEFIVIFRMLFA